MSPWPRPPRLVPRRVALATWGPFGRISSAALAIAVLVALGFWGADDFRSPRVDWQLDAGQGVAAIATIVDVARATQEDGRPADLATYTFRFRDGAGNAVEASCKGEPGLGIGNECTVDYRPDAPAAARLRGMLHSQTTALLRWYPGAVLLPLVLATGLWLARAYRTFAIARHGHAATAVLLAFRAPRRSIRRRRGWCRLRYRFHGSDGSDHEAWQWERPDSPLARACAAAAVDEPLADAFAVFAEFAPTRSRLVASADVVEASA